MKPFIVFALFIIISGFPLSRVYGDSPPVSEALLIQIYELDGGAEFLEQVMAQVEADQEEIDELRALRDELEERIFVLQGEAIARSRELKGTKGVFIGTGFGYPMNWNAIIQYRFYRWGVYSQFNIGRVNQINGGLFFKVGK